MKVFCIGYPRTGTHSIATALERMGFNVWHYSTQHYYDFAVDTLRTKNIDNPIFDNFDAFADTPIFYFYKELDQKYPGSKFILTIRNREDWLDSIRWMMGFTEKNHPNKNEHNRFFWKNPYVEMIGRHTVEVLNYFNDRDRLHDVFVKDIESMNYPELAEFLGKEPFNAKFPHEHKRHED